MILNASIDKILSIVGASDCSVDRTVLIRKIASLETAGSQDLAVLLERGDASVFDAVALDKIEKSQAAVILSQKPVVSGKNYIIVQDSLTAFEKLVAFAQKDQDEAAAFEMTVSGVWVSKRATVHPTCILAPGVVISSGATIGEETIIGALTFVGKQCVIGSHVILHPGVKILDRCCVGDFSIIHAGAVIGSDGFGYSVTKNGLRKIPQIGNVTVGRWAEIGANCTIDRASFDSTIIGSGVKFDNGVHIAHNVVVGDGTAILAQTGIAGSAKIGIGCQIGGQVAIKNDVVIGNGAKIVSKSAVMNDVKDGDAVCGFPAMPFMQWKRQQVLINRLPDFAKIASTVKENGGTKKNSLLAKIKKLFS